MLRKSLAPDNHAWQILLSHHLFHCPQVKISLASSANAEYFHVIMPSTCVGYMAEHEEFKKSNGWTTDDQLFGCTSGGERTCGAETFRMLGENTSDGVNPYTQCKVTFKNTRWEQQISFLACDLCWPLPVEFSPPFFFFWQRPADILQVLKEGGSLRGTNRSSMSVAGGTGAWPAAY